MNMIKLLSITSCCIISIGTNVKHSQQGALAFVTPLSSSRKSRNAIVILGQERAESKLEEPSLSIKDTIYNAHFRDYIVLDDHEVVRKEDLGNLLSICREVQNSPDYQPAQWADSCRVIYEKQHKNNHPKVIATRNVQEGDVLTLFPIHALGLNNNIDGVEYNEFSSKTHEQLFRSGDAVRLNVPLNRVTEAMDLWSDPAAAVVGKNQAIGMFSISFPGEEVVHGWLGGIVKTTSKEEEANCINLPLQDASPFYAIVATRDIIEGDELIQATETSDWDQWENLKDIVHERQTKDLLTLRNHIRRAFVGSFHQINLDYPGLKKIHSDPDIYEIENFLTEDECDRMIAKIRPNLDKQDIRYIQSSDSFVENDEKNYQSVLVPSREIPTIINKLTTLANCGKENVGFTHCINYEKGQMQQISSHVDCIKFYENELFARPEHRLDRNSYHSWAIVFCYLNDVDDGGATYFNSIDLHVKPTRGKGLIHLCADLDGRPDTRTMHQGSAAIDEKWLIAMTLYNTTEITHEFLEFRLDPLSKDVI